MDNLMIPKDYKSALNLHDTQIGIKTVKDFFQVLLAEELHLLRVSAPLFVDPASGLNDNLNGVERPVSFGIMLPMTLAIGFCPPPYGINLFVASAVSGVSMGKMMKYMLWFLLALLIVLMLTTYWAPFTLFLL